ncbi:hypothetical protein [Stakelama pacifica]|nr:hypothetical protein [Stakelama pacifica]
MGGSLAYRALTGRGVNMTEFMMLLAAVVGIGRAFERIGQNPDTIERQRITLLLLVIFWLICAAADAESWRGFLYEAFAPFGAYLAARAITEPFAPRLIRLKQRGVFRGE